MLVLLPALLGAGCGDGGTQAPDAFEARLADDPSPAPTPLPWPTPGPSPTPAPAPPDGAEPLVDELPDEAVEIAFTGDVNLGGRVGDLIRQHGPDYPWSGIDHLLRRADLTVVNLECAISTRGSPRDKEFTFRGRPSSVPAMAEAGVDVASVANNHAVDYGREAFRDTLRHLRDGGIASVGGGRDTGQAYRPLYVDLDDLRIGLVAATRVLPAGFGAGPDRPGVASAYEEARLLAAVEEARSRADVVAVLIHWGVELATEPDETQVRLGRALVDAGADIVAGHHPHVLQPVVRYGGAIIAYSLGNFVFSSGSHAPRRTMLLRVGVLPDGGLVAAETPVEIDGVRPRPIG